MVVKQFVINQDSKWWFTAIIHSREWIMAIFCWNSHPEEKKVTQKLCGQEGLGAHRNFVSFWNYQHFSNIWWFCRVVQRIVGVRASCLTFIFHWDLQRQLYNSEYILKQNYKGCPLFFSVKVIQWSKTGILDRSTWSPLQIVPLENLQLDRYN